MGAEGLCHLGKPAGPAQAIVFAVDLGNDVGRIGFDRPFACGGFACVAPCFWNDYPHHTLRALAQRRRIDLEGAMPDKFNRSLGRIGVSVAHVFDANFEEATRIGTSTEVDRCKIGAGMIDAEIPRVSIPSRRLFSGNGLILASFAFFSLVTIRGQNRLIGTACQSCDQRESEYGFARDGAGPGLESGEGAHAQERTLVIGAASVDRRKRRSGAGAGGTCHSR